jgi:hypothetical protein
VLVLVSVLSVVDTAPLAVDEAVEAIDETVEKVDDVVEELDVDDELSDDKNGAACFELPLRVAAPTLSTGQP